MLSPPNEQSCTLCPLHESSGVVRVGVRGRGSPGGILFIGISPGPEENLRGQCFIGRSGRRLEILCNQNVPDVPVAFTNLVGCMPPKNKPPVKCTRICWPAYGEHDVETFQPKAIVLLGNEVADFLLGKETGSTVAGRRTRTYAYKGIPTIVTYHPASTLRQGKRVGSENLACLISDIQRAARIATGAFVEFKPNILHWDHNNCANDTFRDYFGSPKPLVVDVETTSLRPWLGNLVRVGAADMADPSVQNVANNLRFAPTGPAFAFVGWNFSFDSQWLGPEVFDHPWIDGMVLHGLLYPERKHRSLKVVGPELTGVHYQKTLADGIMENPEELDNYLALDLWQTAKCTAHLLAEVKHTPANRLWPWLMRLEQRLAYMQRLGCKIDQDEVIRVRDSLFDQQCFALNELIEIAKGHGYDLRGSSNPADFTCKLSKNGMTHFIYHVMKYPERLTKKGNLCLDGAARESLTPYDQTGVLKLYETYLQRQKEITTYINPLLRRDCVDVEGYAHPSPHLVARERSQDASSEGRGGGTITGRLVWLDPSLQVYPPSCRGVIVSRWGGGSIGVADLSQIEPRCLAWLSGESILIDLYQRGLDIYRFIAARSLGITESDVTKEIRRAFKTVVLAILYGAGAEKIQEVIRLEAGRELTHSGCVRIIAWFHENLSNLMQWAETIRERVSDGLPIITPTGRFRKFSIAEGEKEAHRQAINFIPQSFASEINHAILLSMPRDEFNGVLCIPPTVHDSLAFDVRPGVDLAAVIAPYYEGIRDTLKREFGIDFTVPIAYEVKVGARWQ